MRHRILIVLLLLLANIVATMAVIAKCGDTTNFREADTYAFDNPSQTSISAFTQPALDDLLAGRIQADLTMSTSAEKTLLRFSQPIAATRSSAVRGFLKLAALPIGMKTIELANTIAARAHAAMIPLSIIGGRKDTLVEQAAVAAVAVASAMAVTGACSENSTRPNTHAAEWRLTPADPSLKFNPVAKSVPFSLMFSATGLL